MLLDGVQVTLQRRMKCMCSLKKKCSNMSKRDKLLLILQNETVVSLNKVD